MIDVTFEYNLPVTPEEVFAFISIPNNDELWQSACERVRLQPGETATLGGKYEIDFSMLGRKMFFVAEICDYDPGKSYGYQVVTGPMKYRGQWYLTPDGTGTWVKWTFSVDPGKFFGVLPNSILKKVISSIVEKDVLTLRKLLSEPRPTTAAETAPAAEAASVVDAAPVVEATPVVTETAPAISAAPVASVATEAAIEAAPAAEAAAEAAPAAAPATPVVPGA